jgi:hypothetical protein
VDVVACQRIQVERHRRDERLSLTGLHLGDVAFVEGDPAHQLNVEEAHSHRPLERLANGGIGLEEDVLGGLARCEPLAELGGLRRQVRLPELLLECADIGGLALEPLEPPAFADAEKFFEVAEVCGHEPRVSEATGLPLSRSRRLTEG